MMAHRRAGRPEAEGRAELLEEGTSEETGEPDDWEPGLSVSDVAAVVAMQSSNVSAAIRALVERGLVSKTPREDDRRVSVLHPTPKARNDKRAIDDALADGIAEVLAVLPPESVATLLTATPAMRGLAGALARPSKPVVARIGEPGRES